MKKALERLDIYVHGDRLHEPKKVELISRKRSQRDVQPKVDIPDHFRKEVHKPRASRKRVEAGPNAPLLKRVIRNPQSLDKGYFTKHSVERMVIQAREKVVFPRIVKEELQRDRKIRKIQPMKLHPKATTVQIPSVDEWLGGASD